MSEDETLITQEDLLDELDWIISENVANSDNISDKEFDILKEKFTALSREDFEDDQN